MRPVRLQWDTDGTMTSGTGPRRNPAGAEAPWHDEERVYRDDLTGLYNRRFLYPYVQRHLDGPAAAAPLSLVMIDVDDFKKVNDTYGPAVGDDIIKAFAGQLQRRLGPNDAVVRFAGDEFVILMPGKRKAEAARFAEQLRRLVSRAAFEAGPGGRKLGLTVSVGISQAPVDGKTVRELVEAADDALHSAKHLGRDRVVVHGEVSTDQPRIRTLLGGFPCPRFVGRATEIARANALSHLGERGPTTLVLLQGTGGVGKSRLLEEMARSRAESGDLTLWTNCREELRKSPYAPVADMIRQLTVQHPGVTAALSRALGPDKVDILSRRFPELRDSKRGESAPDKEWRSQFFATVLEALRFLGREYKLSLSLDDVHNADAATLKVLTFLLRHDRQDAQGAGMPLFASVSTENTARPGSKDTPFGHFWRFVESWPTVGVVGMGPLPTDEVAGMIDACFPGNRFEAGFAAHVAAVTDGSPLFVEEVLIVLALSGFVTPVGPTWRMDKGGPSSLPGTLSELLSSHFAKLDEETVGALHQAAVIGSEFSVGLLQRVLETNEGRAMEIADRAVSRRLLADQSPGASGNIRFVNREIQKLTYERVDESTKKKVHGRVSRLKEHFEVVDMDDALAEVAFHAAREGDDERAQMSRERQEAEAANLYRSDESDHYFVEAGKIIAPQIESQIAEATTTLGDAGMVALPKVLKGLLGVQRGVQMYPPGSEYTKKALHGFLEVLRPVLQPLDGLTLKERGGRLEINGLATDRGRFGVVGDEVVNLLRRAHVHSVTFIKSTTPRDVVAFGQGVTTFGAKGYHRRENDWKELLNEQGARGIGVVPKKYRATVGGAQLVGTDTKLEGLASESARHLPLLNDILRFTAGTAEATLLYPKGSETVKRAVEGLERALAGAHRLLTSVNLGVTEDGFLVNDLRLDARSFGPAVQAMRDVLGRAEIQSLSFRKGVSATDLELLFRYLRSGRAAMERGRLWAERLAGVGIRHIGVDEYVFVAADVDGGAEEEVLVELQTNAMLDRETLLKMVLESEPIDLLEGRLRAELPDLLTELVLDDNKGAPAEILRRIFLNLDSPDPPVRQTALEVVRELVVETSQIVGRELTTHCTSYVAHLLREERAPGPLTALVTLSGHVAGFHIRGGDLRAASRILWQLGKGFQVDPHIDEDSKSAAADVVERLMESQPFERALTDLWTPNEKRRALALHLLEGCGSQATERVLQLAMKATDEKTVQIHCDQLGAIEQRAALGDRLAARITPFVDADEVLRVLHIADTVGCQTPAVLVRAFQHPHGPVLDRATTMLKRAPREDARKALEKLARLGEPRIRARVITLLGELAPVGAVAQLASWLEDESLPTARLIEICVALGKTGDDAAVPVLEELLETSWWTRLSKQEAPDEMRVAAAWALASIASEAALDVLQDLLDDRQDGVREAAASLLQE